MADATAHRLLDEELEYLDHVKCAILQRCHVVGHGLVLQPVEATGVDAARRRSSCKHIHGVGISETEPSRWLVRSAKLKVGFGLRPRR